MNLFDLLKEHAGMSQEEAENYFHIENTASEWTLKSIRYLEPTKFHAVLKLAAEYGGTYDPKAKGGVVHIPKEGLDKDEKLEEALGHTPPSKATLSKAEEEDVVASRKEIQDGKAKTFKTADELIVELHKNDNESSEEYALSRSLKGKLGQLVPCLEDAEGRIFDGIHRKAIDPKAWTVKLDKIKTPVDRALARMTVNFCRRHYMPEEMKNDIGLLIGSGLTVEEIIESTGISERTIYKYKPQELKNQVRVEAGKEAHRESQDKAASSQVTVKTQDAAQPEIPQRIQRETLNELVECANCHMGFHISKATLIDNKNVCPRCAEHVKPQPKPKIEPTPFKPKETGDFRVAQMHPKVSKMDTAMLVRLQNNEELRKLGWRIEFQKPRTKVICISDVTLIDRFGKEIDVYFDFVETHKNSEVEDDFRRQEAARIHKVEVIPLLYDAVTETEERRLEKAIVEQLKIRGSF